MSDSDSDTDSEPTIADDKVVSKYKMAGDIANTVMKELIPKCVGGASTIELSKVGDDLITKESKKVYKRDKDMPKGVGFPTCISVNNCICHYSPLNSEKGIITLKDGDVVKIDLAAHVDGFIAAVAHTLVIGCTAENPISDRRADVIQAAYLCQEAAYKLVKEGNKTNTVTDTMNKVAESFNCKPIEGMLSHQLMHNRIDGDKTIIQNPTEKQKQDHEEYKFECHEVYAIDCLVSSGDGHPRDQDTRTTVYKRNPDNVYQLRMKTSRVVFSEIEKKFDAMCFTLRSLNDEKKARMGILECCKHDLCTPFPVLWEKEGEFVAQFKFTVLLLPNKQVRITNNFFDEQCYKSSFKITDPEVEEILNPPEEKGDNPGQEKASPAQTTTE